MINRNVDLYAEGLAAVDRRAVGLIQLLARRACASQKRRRLLFNIIYIMRSYNGLS